MPSLWHVFRAGAGKEEKNEPFASPVVTASDFYDAAGDVLRSESDNGSRFQQV